MTDRTHLNASDTSLAFEARRFWVDALDELHVHVSDVVEGLIGDPTLAAVLADLRFVIKRLEAEQARRTQARQSEELEPLF